MAGVSPWHVNVPTPSRPKPVVGPQNVGLPGYRPGDPGNPYPGLAAPAPVAEMANVAPPPPPPPPDFNQMTLADPTFLQNKADIARQNEYTMADLLKNFRRGAQGYQDNANAHGALFSGAAVNAQNQASAAYDQAGTRQAANVLSQQNQNYNAVWQRLLQQLAGGA